MNTLKEYLDTCISVFGPDSKATKFIEKKIEDSPNKENEEVIADPSQMTYLLKHLHNS